MKRFVRWILIGVSGIFLAVVAFFLFIYFSAANNIEINANLTPFNNRKDILRLDSIRITPDSLTSRISSVSNKANVRGFAVSIVNDNELVYQQYFGSKDKSKGTILTAGTIFYGASFSKTIFFQAILKQDSPRYNELITPQVRIRSKQQFGPNAMIDTNENDSIRLSYGLGFGLYFTPYGKAFFKEGHLEGWQHYAVGFPEKGIAVVMMSNSDNAEGVFNELIKITTGNRYTPWFWEGYIPAKFSN